MANCALKPILKSSASLSRKALADSRGQATRDFREERSSP
jgi:hypothetical protein